MRAIPPQAIDFIAKHEGGFILTAYRDATGTPTIGAGSTEGVVMGQTITLEEARSRLADDLQTAAIRIEDRIGAATVMALTENMYAALLSFVFNCGAGSKWTIWKVLQARNWQAVPDQMRRFVYSKGQRLQGLVNRRNDEAALWNSGLPAQKPLPTVGVGPVVLASAPAIAAASSHSPIIIPIALAIAGALAVTGATYIFFLSTQHKGHPMPVSSDFQADLDSIAASTQKIADFLTAGAGNTAALQAQLDAANATIASNAQDHADTLSALNDKVAALESQVAALTPPPAP